MSIQCENFIRFKDLYELFYFQYWTFVYISYQTLCIYIYSTEYDDEDIEDEEDVIDSFAESKLGLDDIEDKEKMEKLGMDE